MHWTLQALIGLCIICAALNVAQKAMVGSVRIIGILICGGWVIQELWWAFRGTDSALLIFVCDVAIMAWLWRHRDSLSFSEVLIAALMPAVVACWAWQFLAGESVMRWWLNWSLVAAQMVIGLPSLNMGRSLHSFTHGPLRAKSKAA